MPRADRRRPGRGEVQEKEIRDCFHRPFPRPTEISCVFSPPHSFLRRKQPQIRVVFCVGIRFVLPYETLSVIKKRCRWSGERSSLVCNLIFCDRIIDSFPSIFSFFLATTLADFHFLLGLPTAPKSSGNDFRLIETHKKREAERLSCIFKRITFV